MTETAPLRKALHGRREAIVAALVTCVLKQGYAQVTLTEVAAEAGMSVSHLLYYFPGKEAIMIALCDQIQERALSALFQQDDESPEAGINRLARNMFAQRSDAGGITREIKALAMHRPEFRSYLAESRRIRHENLRHLFARTPRAVGISPDEAAIFAGAIWDGLLDSVEFSGNLTDAKAEALFRMALDALAGLPPNGAQSGPPIRAQ